MSPFVFSADHSVTVEGRQARAAALVPAPPIAYVFAEYAAAVARGDRARAAEIRLAADPDLQAELDGFNEPAAA
ncbi:hypothetical protein ACIF8T_21660 [Streptomyces sp. NPDC085946]|uniref:hypothetical protein n=1 Tax=Streptomyces sp. NPDC085946 TaxID=3365744 RepID=UPI0037D66439